MSYSSIYIPSGQVLKTSIGFDSIVSQNINKAKTRTLRQDRSIFRPTRETDLSQEPEVGPPSSGNGLEEGNEVEACEGGTMINWLRGRIVGVSGDTLAYDVRYDDGTFDQDLCRYCVRRFQLYNIGDLLQYFHIDEYAWSRVLGANPLHDQYDIMVLGAIGSESELVVGASGSFIRRVDKGERRLKIGTQVVARHPKQSEEFWCKARVEDFDDDSGSYSLFFLEDDYEGRPEHFINPDYVRRYAWAQ